MASKRKPTSGEPAPRVAEQQPQPDTKRPRREAAKAAAESIKQHIDAESASDSNFLASSASAASAAAAAAVSSSSASSKPKALPSSIAKLVAQDTSGTVLPSKLKLVPPELLDEQVPGALRTPELYTAKIPKRRADGSLDFEDAPEFRPNLTPAEVLQAGSFGGYYFRPIASNVTGKVHVDAWREFPEEWFAGLKVARAVANPTKDLSVNAFKVNCGQDLRQWEESGWIVAQDPFGWFQWYCRFYLGRRTPDDSRQISRWVGVAGSSGRWKTNLIHKCVAANKAFDDASVSPVVRQTLQHWAYRLTEAHFNEYAKLVRAGKSTSFIRR